MTKLPIFSDEEVESFKLQFAKAQTERFSYFAVYCRDIARDQKNLDHFAAAYLLMNVLLMGRLNRRILKLIYLTDSEPDRLVPSLNYLRAIFGSSFASLENVELWLSMLKKETKLSVPSLEKIRSVVEFVRGSGIADDVHAFHQANVFLGVADPDMNSQFQLTEIGAFQKEISTADSKVSIYTTELFSPSGGVNVAVDRVGRSFFVDIDFSDAGWLQYWVGYLEELVSSKLHAGPA